MNSIDKSRELLRELQLMLFDEKNSIEIFFSKTLEIDKNLDNASTEYNKYINSIEKNK